MDRRTSVQKKRDKYNDSESDIEDEVWFDCSGDTYLKQYMMTNIHQDQLTGKTVPQLTQALMQEMTMQGVI
jgi:hypothetical protein